MKKAILVHGYYDLPDINNPQIPTPSNSHWLPWLSKELFIKGIHTVAIEMPIANLPIYQDWKREFERYQVSSETILVGHSCGGGFLVRWLSENPNIKVESAVLVAPSLGLTWEDKSFFDFDIDPNIADRVNKLSIIVADDDKRATLDAVDIYKSKLSRVKVINLKTGGHFTKKAMGTEEFPELLEVVLS